MKHLRDPVLWALATVLLLTVTAFLSGLLPYPFGILVLLLLIVARISFRR